MTTELIRDVASTTAPSPISPWVAYLTGKKESADHFLQDMVEGVTTVPDEKTGKPKKRKTGNIIKPNEEARNAFADAVVGKPDRVERVMLMVQALASSNSSIHNIVMDLAERSIKRLGIISSPEPLDATNFSTATSSWLANSPKKPLKSAELNVLFLLVHFGRQRRWLDEYTILTLVTSAVSSLTKSRPTHTQLVQPVPTELELILAAPPSAPELASLIAYCNASKTETNKLKTQIQSQAIHISHLTNENTDLNAILTGTRAEIASLNVQKSAAETTIVNLEKQIVSTRASYQHKLDDVRGRIRGTLQGQFTRWIETSLHAVRANPPRTQVVEERLEDVLKLLEKEIQWLQPSA